jgi:hypothetical protein
MNHSQVHSAHWCRQADKPRNAVKSVGLLGKNILAGEVDEPGNGVERVFQISKISPGDERPLVIATCSEASAKKLLAGLATREGKDRFAITAVFEHPVLPGFEGMER